MITNDFLEQACSEVSEYSDDRMMAEFEQFFQEQPAICEFVVEATHESDPKIRELSLFLSYMVFKAVKCGRPNDVTIVTPEMIENAQRDSEYWIDQISQAEDTQMEEISTSLQDDAEPHLIQYVISELNQPIEDGMEWEDEQKGEVFFVLKTVISSLARR
jgi:hypothetical protein